MLATLYSIYLAVDEAFTKFCKMFIMSMAWMGMIIIIFEIFSQVKRLIEYYSIRPYQPATDPPPVCVCHLIGKNKKDANTNTDANHEPTNTATDPATETKKNE